MSEKKKYTGGCHCGAVKFEAELEIKDAMSCNCSICTKKGSLLTFAPESDFTLLTSPDALTEYLFNKHVIHHTFCKTCGIQAFSHATGPDGTPMRAIDVKCIDGLDFEKLPVTRYDGKSR